MKRILLFMMFVAICCRAAAETTKNAYDFADGGIYYNILSANTVEVTYQKEHTYRAGSSDDHWTETEMYSDYSGTINIPEIVTYSGITYKVIRIGDYAFTSTTYDHEDKTYSSGGGNVEYVTLPATLQSIGKQAFVGSKLKAITIPDGISVGDNAFEGCEYLETITLGNISFGKTVFAGCSNLKSITLSRNFSSMGSGMFDDCKNLESIIVENGNVVYESSAGSNALIIKKTNKLVLGCKNTIIPSTVVIIGEHAFYGCTDLTEIILPSLLKYIEGYAFSGCIKLSSINIPKSVNSIGAYAFEGCVALGSIAFEDGLPNSIGKEALTSTAWYKALPNGLVYIDNKVFWWKGTIGSAISIKDGTTAIGRNALKGCTKITSINMPASIKAIEQNALRGCSSLNSVDLASVETIGDCAFYGCEGLQSVVIPNTVISIGANAFEDCHLTSIVLGRSVTNIGSRAFYDTVDTGVRIGDNEEVPDFSQTYGNLKTVTSYIPKPFEIEGDVFGTSFKYTWYGYVDTEYGSMYNETEKLEEAFTTATLTVPYGTKSLYSAALGWNSFSTIEEEEPDLTPYSITVNGTPMTFMILSEADGTVQVGNGTDAAIGVETAGELIIPTTVALKGSTYKVASIAESAFNGCQDLTSIEIPASITSSGNNSFSGCTGLQKVIVADLVSWCAITFGNKYSNPLYYATHLYSDENTEITDLVIPEGVPNIGAFAFVKGAFNTVTISGSVAQVGSNAFYKCLSLTSLNVLDGAGYIRSNAFYGCTALKSVKLPETVYRLGGSAFYGCTALESIELPSGLIGSGSLAGVGDNAFNSCSNLKQVTSNVQTPSAMGANSFASISPDCILYIPVGTLTSYYNKGRTKEVFGGGVVELIKAEENFNLENAVTADFRQNVAYPDDDYSYTKITDYTTQTTSYRKDLPQPIRLAVPLTSEGEALILETYVDGQIARSDTFVVGQRALEVWNLIPNTSYDYKLYTLFSDKTKKEVTSGTFETEGQVRMMKIDNVRNFRDIGGWLLPNGKQVKYDKVFRCAELGTSSPIITAAGINELLKVQNIGVEIDFGDYDGSPVQANVDFCYYHMGTFYAEGLRKEGSQFKNGFEKTVQGLREGKKVIFHCNAGADRTGAFAFLLEGLLGVSESDLAKDYELTSFVSDNRYRNGSGWKGMINYVKSTFTGESINEKIEQMALGFGISQQDIDDFRNLMTGVDTQVENGKKCATPTISVKDGKLHFECQTEDVQYHSCIETRMTDNDVAIPSKYVVKVYATKKGLKDSDVATANINVAGQRGDADGNGVVDIADAVHIVNLVIGKVDALAPQTETNPQAPQ